MKKLQHPHIVRLFDVNVTQRHVYLMLELCEGGDLAKVIKDKGAMSETRAQHYFKQLASGLLFLRSHNLIHRDLKPQNLLLTGDLEILKIADFGFARYIPENMLAATLCGSPLYMAPEILHHRKYDSTADLWSVGAILYEMVCGRPPYTGANHIELLKNIDTHPVSIPPQLGLSPSLCTLLLGLLQRNPKERMGFRDFFDHAWVRPVPTYSDNSPPSLDQSALFQTANQIPGFVGPTGEKREEKKQQQPQPQPQPKPQQPQPQPQPQPQLQPQLQPQ
eukprot:CAMPEP_0175138064 /NCGR_PEP_ID=MMETSP0087-20121206/10145_1 /TAXON_ID=136419 /ORGANISM="Unknown Unknown, Strain D1" /LENGTH=276 /DNA_ID=CAMNT_0016420933 /DNA_START=284 /DNA_END=1111 /DNA_ORIENTATION=-